MKVKIKIGKTVKVRGIDILGPTEVDVSAHQAAWLEKHGYTERPSKPFGVAKNETEKEK